MTALVKRVWGPAVWTFLHAAAATCDQPEDFRALLRAAARCLPCPECRAEARRYMAARDDGVIVDKTSAATYVWKMHNDVNVRLGKPELLPSEHERLYGARLERQLRRLRRLHRVL